MSGNELGTQKISKLFIQFCIPAIVSMVIAGTQGIIDGIFLGNYVGKNALASVNMVQPFMQVIIGFSMILSVGSLSFIARSLGEGEEERAQNIFKTAFISLSFISLSIAIIGWTYNQEIAIGLGSNEVLLKGVATYTQIIAIFAPLMALMFLFAFTNRVLGKPELYLKATIVSVLINITLDFMLIKKFELGIKGAAFATGIAYTVAFFIVIRPMICKSNTINIFKGRWDTSVIIPTVYNGSSEGVVSIASATTAYLFNMSFMRMAGEVGVAAFTIINYIGQFGVLIMFGISDGIGPILSFNYGDRKYERLRKTLKLAIKVNLIVGILLFGTLFIFGRPLVSLFVNDNETVLYMATMGSKLYAFAFLLCGFNIIYSGYFTAIGDAKASIVIASSRGMVFIFLGIYMLPKLIGSNGVWLTVPFAEFITFMIGMYLINKNERYFTRCKH